MVTSIKLILTIGIIAWTLYKIKKETFASANNKLLIAESGDSTML